MLFIVYNKIDFLENKYMKILSENLNSTFPDMVFINLDSDNKYWNQLRSNSSLLNYFIFFNSKNLQNETKSWHIFDKIYNLKKENKFNKIIEIKIDGTPSPNFFKDWVVSKKWTNDQLCVESITNSIRDNNWNDFKKVANFIYVDAYYKNDYVKNNAKLVNENDDWDVILIKFKAIHDDIKNWDCKILADKVWVDDFYKLKPEFSSISTDCDSWSNENEIFYKKIVPNEGEILDTRNWYSILFFKNMYKELDIKKIQLVVLNKEIFEQYIIRILE